MPSELVLLVSDYVKLSEGRKVLKGNCPFHNDQSESFMIYPVKEIFKCFGCGLEGGLSEFNEGNKGTQIVLYNSSFSEVLLF